MIAAFLSCLPLLGWRDPEMASSLTGLCVVSGDPLFAVFGTTIAFYAPTALIIAVYIKVYIEVKRRIKMRLKATASTRVFGSQSQKDIGELASRHQPQTTRGEEPHIPVETQLSMISTQVVLTNAANEVSKLDKELLSVSIIEPDEEQHYREPSMSAIAELCDLDDISDSATIYDNVSFSEILAIRAQKSKGNSKGDDDGNVRMALLAAPEPSLTSHTLVDPQSSSLNSSPDRKPSSAISKSAFNLNRSSSERQPRISDNGDQRRKSFLSVIRRATPKKKPQQRRVSVAMALMAMAVDHCDLSGSIQSSPGAFSAISEFQQQVEKDAQQQQQQQRQRMSSFRSRIVRTSSAKVRGSANTRPGQSSSTVLDRQNIWKQREHKTAAILLIVTSAFIVCWLPYFVMELVTPLCRCDEYLPPPPIVISSVTWLGYCNSLLNPIIYTVTSADFRIAFKNLLRLA